MRGQKAYGLFKCSSIFFLDSVYMSQNVLNRENFQIQVKKKSVMLPTYETALVFSIGKHPD